MYKCLVQRVADVEVERNLPLAGDQLRENDKIESCQVDTAQAESR
jgi:hypothetical protein